MKVGSSSYKHVNKLEFYYYLGAKKKKKYVVRQKLTYESILEHWLFMIYFSHSGYFVNLYLIAKDLLVAVHFDLSNKVIIPI